MSTYAVIKVGSFQYLVEEGKEYTVPKFEAEAGKDFDAAEVLLVASEKDVKVGDPVVKGAKVVLDILGQEKGEKVVKATYKAKARVRRKVGFRKQVTRFNVKSIKA